MLASKILLPPDVLRIVTRDTRMPRVRGSLEPGITRCGTQPPAQFQPDSVTRARRQTRRYHVVRLQRGEFLALEIEACFRRDGLVWNLEIKRDRVRLAGNHRQEQPRHRRRPADWFVDRRTTSP